MPLDMTLTTPETNRPQWWTRLLTKARKNPASALKDERWLRPELCRDFFDLCNDVALQEPQRALAYAEAAIELASRIGDPHLIHSAQGVMVHAYIARGKRPKAAALLEDYRLAAFSCCGACRGEWLWRQGDLLAESRDPAAREALERSSQELGDDAGVDAGGRLRFVNGIAHHNEGERGQAVDEAGGALLEMSLATPRGYFMDGIAFVACFLQGGAERRHVERARDYLKRFRRRLDGVRDWRDVRIRLAWVEGQLHARLGDRKTAYRCLERARKALYKSGPPRHWLAVSIDLMQLYAQHNNDLNLSAIQRLLLACRNKKDLDRKMRKRLKRTRKVAASSYANRQAAFVWLRRTFIVPVPGLIEELDSGGDPAKSG